MTISTEDLLNSILESLERIDYIKAEDIPNIDLYMDQVTTFIDSRMKSATRKPNEDKILTKTMINNYAKNDLLPPPIKKKYNKDHMLLLIFIYYFKGIISINDIQKLLAPLKENFYDQHKDLKLEGVYETIFGMEYEQVSSLKDDVEKKFRMAEKAFGENESESADFLQQFSFICLLSFDVYVKKLMIEKMIDSMEETLSKKDPSKKDPSKKETVKKETVRKETVKKEAVKKDRPVK